MLGGSEDDLCRPIASKEPGFQLPDAGDWPIPPRPDNWTERKKQKSYEDQTVFVWMFPSGYNWKGQLMGRGNVRSVMMQRSELSRRTRDSSSALLADLQTATNDIKV